jgi:hypothetical protein
VVHVASKKGVGHLLKLYTKLVVSNINNSNNNNSNSNNRVLNSEEKRNKTGIDRFQNCCKTWTLKMFYIKWS